MSGIARRLGCTDGQLYTALIGLVLAAVLFAIGIPPVLRNDTLAAAPRAAADASSAGETSAPATTTTTGLSTPTTLRSPSLVPAPSPNPPVTAAPSNRTPAGAPRPRALPRSVVDAGYTSSTAGTPLSGPEVPEDGMPVGVRLGRADKVSFARLAGTAPNLNLALVDDQAANQLVALAAVRACAVTEPGWVLDTPGAPPDDAPSYDDRRCTDGTQSSTGVWTFDLAEVGDIDERAGIALVPVFEGPVTFQVTFSTVTVTDAEAGA